MEGTEKREIRERERAILIPKKGKKSNKHETLCQALELCVTN